MTLAEQLIKILRIASACFLAMLLAVVPSTSVYAYPASFDPETIFYDSDLYTLPAIFAGKSRTESIALIQNILSQDNAALATTNVFISIDDTGYTTRHPEVQPYLGTTVSAAEVIWAISQENLGKGTWNSIQITEGINPLLLMAIIQKESGIIYGKCAHDTCFDQSTGFRIARATGYACYDGQPCKDEFLGFFSQVYFTARWYKAFTKYCKNGFSGYGQEFQTGKSITLEGTTLTPGSNITCATYYYTPHVSPQRNFYNTLVDISNRAGAANTTPPPAPVVIPTPEPPPTVVPPPAPLESIAVTVVPQTTTSPMPLVAGTFGEPGVSATIQFGNEDPIALTQITGTDWSYQVKFPKSNGTYDIKVRAKIGAKTGEDTSQNELTIQPAVSAPLAPDLVEFTVAQGNKRGENKPLAAPTDPEISIDTIKQSGVAPTAPAASSTPKVIVKQEDPLSDLFAQQRNKQPSPETSTSAASYSFATQRTRAPNSTETPADTKTPLVILASTLTLAFSLIGAQIAQAKRKKRALIALYSSYDPQQDRQHKSPMV